MSQSKFKLHSIFEFFLLKFPDQFLHSTHVISLPFANEIRRKKAAVDVRILLLDEKKKKSNGS